MLKKRAMPAEEAMEIAIFVLDAMGCGDDYTPGRLELFFYNGSQTVDADISPVDDAVFGEISDPECAELLREIYEKDWEQELDDFRDRVLQLRVDEAVDGHIKKKQEEGILSGAVFGLVCGLLVGMLLGSAALFPLLLVASISLSVVTIFMGGPYGMVIAPMVMFLVPATGFLISQASSVLAWLLSVVSAGVIGAAVGSGLGVKYKRKKLSERRFELERGFRDKMNTYMLSPHDMLRFWKNKVEIYLHEKKALISGRIREAGAARAQLVKVAAELRNYKDAKSDLSARELTDRAREFAALIGDATKVNSILQKIEDKFVCRIEELQTLINRQEDMERAESRKEQLEAQARRLLNGTRTTLEEWKEEKQDLQNELSGMMNAFQRELATTKDIIKAEIELSQFSGDPAGLPNHH
jgi:hypothetical protein